MKDALINAILLLVFAAGITVLLIEVLAGNGGQP
jgi:hypothetical protein